MNQTPLANAPPGLDAARALCDRKLAAGDLGLYYGLLFAPARRDAGTALYAFWLEVREINDECRDPTVARLKLGWWHEEIEHAVAGRPRHPVAVALAPVLARYRLPASALHELLEALARHAAASGYASTDALHDHARQTRGRLETLAVRLAEDDAAPADVAAELGALLERATLLRDTGGDARRGRSYLPSEELARHGATVQALFAGPPSDSLCRAIASIAQRLRADIGRIDAALAGAERRALRPLLVAAAIARTLLRQIERRPERVLRERPRVAAPRQLWIAWRTALAA